MNLNIEVIYHALKNDYAISSVPEFSNTPLSSLLLYDGMTFQKNHLYIVEATDFAFIKMLPADIALIVIGMSFIQPGVYPCDILFIREKAPFQLIFNQVAGIFDRLNAWEQELLRYETDYRNIQKILTCSSGILGGALTLADDNLNLLAFTSDPIRDQDYASSTPARLPQPLVREVLEDPEFQSCGEKHRVFLYPEYKCDLNVLCYNLFRENKASYYARLILRSESNEYSKAQAYLLRFLGEMIQRTLSRVSTIAITNSVYKNMVDLINRVLKEPPRHAAAVLPTLQSISWNIHDQYIVALLSRPFERHTAVQNHTFCGQLEMLFEETWAVIYEDYIVLVLNASQNTSFEKEEFNSRLTVFLRENLFKAGISDPIEDFSQLSIGYQKAKAALELGSEKEPALWSYYFENYTIDYIIRAASREMSFTYLIDKRLLLLKDYDQKNGSQLFETLKTYIKCKYNITQASEMLYIHRTTFPLRLERISRLTGLDLNDWDTRLMLMLSIRMLENS